MNEASSDMADHSQIHVCLERSGLFIQYGSFGAMESVPTTTDVVSSNPEVYNIM